jgi:hypothetical protein
LTVIASLEGPDKSIVIAFDDTDSAPFELVALKSMVGVLSLSVMV